MDMSATGLKGKKALVTGGAGGIGRACAMALVSAGATVVIADRDAVAARSVAAELNTEVWIVDLADTAPIEQATLDYDILINNAGFQSVNPVEGFPPETFRAMWSLMVEVPFLLARASLPHMYSAGYGRIINISSIHGLRASAFKSGYVSAKHGLEGLSKVIALEGAEHGVTSNCINPGYVRTPLVESQIAEQSRIHGIPESEVVTNILLAKNAIKRLVEPSEVGALAEWLTREEASMITGSSYSIDGGWTA
jgi:3-hydroxybutyrate dehydrogenase